MKTGRGGLQGNYSFKSRFEEGEGTNPEELIGAAHAGCFSMAFANALSQAGFVPTSVDTTARVALERTDAGFAITRIELETKGDVPGIDESTFQKIAADAKENCPISKLLSPGVNEITMTATLV
jgi:osmotically inducible protein OsmC